MTPERWKQIEAVFERAVEIPDGDREDFLTRECGGDDDLRREVEKLLKSDNSAAGFIESPVWTDSSFINTTAKKELSDSFERSLDESDEHTYIGKTIGAFLLTREIGRGGMGAVYLAERSDGEFFQRVAIKLIKRGMDSDFVIRRFRHERQILASFEHPFIARLLDGGTTTDGVPYFVMEFVEGKTFYTYSDTNRLDLRDRLKIFQKVCSAIEYAHLKQIIHRDIKPSNILINSVGSPKLLDFGIAKILDPDLIHESINPTASMLRMMTPDYASPEQIQGIEVTPSSDIYSLGVLLYELLTGHRPYNFAGRALHDVSYVICNTMPKLPSRILEDPENLLSTYVDGAQNYLQVRRTTAAKLAQELGRGLDDIVMKALNKEPEARYNSVSEMSRDISRYLSGSKVSAPKYSPTVSKEFDPLLRTSANSRSLAVLPFSFVNLAANEDTDDRFLGVGLADALITRLSKVRKFVVRPTSSISSFGDGPIDPVRAGRDLNVDFILNGTIKKANDRLRVTVQLLNVAENAAIWATSIDEVLSDVFSLEDTLSTKVVEGLLPQLTTNEREEFVKRGTENPQAFEHYLRGRYYFNTFTEDSFAKAFVHFHSAISADPTYAHAYAGIADYYNWLGILGVLPPNECFLPAIEAARKAVELDAELSEAHASLGFSLHAGNYEWSRAEHHLMKAIELNPSNANAYIWYSIVMYTEGRFSEGLQYAHRSLEIDPLTPFNHHNLGWGLYYARRYDEAAAVYRKVIADFPSYSFGYYGLSKVQRIQGETSSSIREIERAKELMGGSIFALLAEAESYSADGQVSVAKQKLNELKELSSERYVSPYQLALSHCFLKEPQKALDLLEKAAEQKEAWLNWMGVDPGLDLIRGDKRFEDILETTGYRPFFNSFSASSPVVTDPRPVPTDIHSLTTLVIEDGDITHDGIGQPRGTKRLTTFAAGIGMLAILLAAAFGVYRLMVSEQTASTPARGQGATIVVLPFDSPGSEYADLGVGFSDALTNKLGNIKNLQVMSANTGRSLKNVAPRDLDIGLGIAYVLRGNIERSGNAAKVSADLIDTRDGRTVFQENVEASNGDLFGIQTKIAERIWRELGIDPLPLERQQVERSYTQNIAAYSLYLRGRSEMTNRSAHGLEAAAATFEESIKEDAEFALAYVGLADSLSLLNLYSVTPPAEAYPQAKRYATKALEIDPNLAEAHATLAYIKFFHDRDRTGSELEFRRAIQVNPSYAPAHHWFALTLAAKGAKVDAETEIEIAKRLDPKAAAIRSAAGVVNFHLGEPLKAISECDAAIALDPRSVPAFKVKRWAYTALGDRASASEALSKEIELSGGSPNDSGWKVVEIQIDAIGGITQELQKKLDTAVKDPSVGKNLFGFAYEIALANNALGRTEDALAWLERSEAAGGHSFNFAATDPRLSNLRNEPRYIALVNKLR